MANTKSSERESKKAGTIQIFNHTSRMLGVGLRRRKAGTPGTGADAYIVNFLPGNNTIDAEEWVKCKEHPHVSTWLSRITHLDRVGKPYKTRYLEEDYFDKDFESESMELGVRMHELRQVQQMKS